MVSWGDCCYEFCNKLPKLNWKNSSIGICTIKYLINIKFISLYKWKVAVDGFPYYKRDKEGKKIRLVKGEEDLIKDRINKFLELVKFGDR
jgi:hypothetical protein